MKLRPRKPLPSLPSVSTEIMDHELRTEIKEEVEERTKSEDSPVPVANGLKDKISTSGASKSTICDICGKIFKNAAYVPEHRKRHSDLKPLKCTLCDRGFNMAKDLANHVKSHLKEHPFSCTICNKSYTRRSLLNYHMRSHTGERPYQCDVCARTFTRPFNLAEHKLLHSSKRFKCESCDKLFVTKSSLRTHIQGRHTKGLRFECSICKKQLSCSQYLRLHIRYTHEGDNLPILPCPKSGCSREFKIPSGLHCHVRDQHPNEALFKCQLCPMSFLKKSLLNQHMKTSKSHGKS